MHTNLSTRARGGLALGITLSLGLLAAGCGDDSKDDEGAGGNDSAYCKALESAQEDIAGMSAGAPDMAAFSKVVTAINELVPIAEGDVAEAWEGLALPLSALEEALVEADVDLMAFATAASSGQTPAGVTPEQMIELGELVAALQDPKVSEYADTISADAKDNCDLELSVPGS